MNDRNASFTQADMTRAVGTVRAEERQKREQLVAEHQGALEAAQSRIAELEGQVTSLTSERDGAITERDSAVAAATEERAEHEARLAALQREHEGTKLEHRKARDEKAITQALISARVLAQASDVATATFLRECELEHGESGALAAVKYQGQRFERLGDAAIAFLKARPFYQASGAGSGNGSKPPNTGGGHARVASEDPRELIQRGWQKPPQ